MVKLAGIIPVLAKAQGMPEATVLSVTRSVRTARYVNTGPRGPGGAEMTDWDAANLLLGVTCAAMAKDAGAAVHRYHSLVADTAEVWTKEGREPLPDGPDMDRVSLKNLCPEPMQWLGSTARGLLLGDALERLIAMARTGDLQEVFRELVRPHYHEDAIDRVINELGEVYLKLEFRRPRPSGTIAFGMRGANPFVSVSFSHRSELEMSEELDALQVGDRTETVTVTHRTIFALGEALRR